MRDGIGYIRVSRVAGRAGESFQSPDLQRERIEQASAANDVLIVAWYEDLDESGSKWQRPGFQQALAAVEEGRASVIVVARLTRFARSVLDTHRGLERLERAGGQLLAADINVDVTTPTGKLIRGVLAVLAEFELEVAREQWDAAKQSAVARGVKIANRAPAGYRFDAAHRLEPDPETAGLIPELFRRRVAGESQSAIVSWWHEQTGRWLHRQTVGQMIRNRAYLGDVVYGDLVREGAHEPLVTLELWEQAQRAPTLAPARGNGTLLAGILVCGSCGRKMAATSGAARADDSVRLVYRCQRQSKDGPCFAPASVIRERADEYVTDAILAWARTEVHRVGPYDRQATAVLATLRAAEAELASYLSADLVSVVGETVFRQGAVDRQRAVDDAKAAVEALRIEERAGYARLALRDEWPRLTVQERRRLIAAAVEKVVVHRSGGRPVAIEDRCEIVWRGGGVDGLPS